MTAAETDRFTIRLIIICAFAMGILCLIGGSFLVWLFRNDSTSNGGVMIAAGGLLAAPTGCITGFFGLLARTSTQRTATDPAVDTQTATPVTENNAPTPPAPEVDAIPLDPTQTTPKTS